MLPATSPEDQLLHAAMLLVARRHGANAGTLTIAVKTGTGFTYRTSLPAGWQQPLAVGSAVGIPASSATMPLQAPSEPPDDADGRGRPDLPFVPTAYQEAILEALDGVAMKTRQLGGATGGDHGRLYKPHGLQELRERGLVDHHPVLGFYRPDAPPPQLQQARQRQEPTAGPQMTGCPKAIVDLLRSVGHRMTLTQLTAALAMQGEPYSEATVKNACVVMVDMGVLTNCQEENPRGYGLPEWA